MSELVGGPVAFASSRLVRARRDNAIEGEVMLGMHPEIQSPKTCGIDQERD